MRALYFRVRRDFDISRFTYAGREIGEGLFQCIRSEDVGVRREWRQQVATPNMLFFLVLAMRKASGVGRQCKGPGSVLWEGDKMERGTRRRRGRKEKVVERVGSQVKLGSNTDQTDQQLEKETLYVINGLQLFSALQRFLFVVVVVVLSFLFPLSLTLVAVLDGDSNAFDARCGRPISSQHETARHHAREHQQFEQSVEVSKMHLRTCADAV